MAVVDIFNIPENVISRDLKGRFLCIYGAELLALKVVVKTGTL